MSSSSEKTLQGKWPGSVNPSFEKKFRNNLFCCGVCSCGKCEGVETAIGTATALGFLTMAANGTKDLDAAKNKTTLSNHPRKWSKTMLVLTRKKGETILIGDSIVIKVISCGRGKAKIGVDAPTTTRVLRGELVDSVDRVQAITIPAAPIRLAR